MNQKTTPPVNTPIGLNPRIFRPGSKLPNPVSANFVVTNGGIGDYVAAMSAILYIAKAHPQVHGKLFVPDYFLPLAANFMKPHAHWELFTRSEMMRKMDTKLPIFGPYDKPINGLGCHLLDLGFIYYLGINPPPPDGNFYPELDTSQLPDLPDDFPRPFAVLTPGATFANRQMHPSAFNAIKDHLLEKGITPVYLGNGKVGERNIVFSEEYNYDGFDLRNKTSLLYAAKIISKAKMIVGIDNGLLHLAATTGVPIIFGYTIAAPWHREPRRRSGRIYNIYPDPNELTCTFCQSQMRYMFNHDFSTCMYKDLACLSMLADPKPWCDLIDIALEETDENKD